jgi:phosphoglycerate kinase
MGITIIDQLPTERLNGVRVLVRVNPSFDLPSALPTLEYLIAAGARTIIGAGAFEPARDRLADELRRMLGRPVLEIPGIGPGDVLRSAHESGRGEILLLPDLGSYAEDASNDPEFARQLASLADVYCNDATALTHLSLASTVRIVRFARTATAGFGLARDIDRMETLIDKSAPPVAVIIGGADLESKLTLIWNLCGKADWLFLGGAICFTFFRAKGLEVGAAPVDERLVPAAQEILKDAEGKTEIVLPSDFVAVRRSSPDVQTVAATGLLPEHVPTDIGDSSLRDIALLLSQARTLFWNGPLGVWEIEPFGESTRRVGQMVAKLAGERLEGIVCGESLTGALRQFDLLAGPLAGMEAPAQPTLRFLSGQMLPAVEALRRPASSGKAECRRLILAVDSTGSLEPVRRAAPVFENAGAEIHLLLVDSARREKHPADSRPLKAATIFQQADALLAQFGLRIAVHTVRDGDPAECVLDYAQEIGADLLAVPSHSLQDSLRILSRDWSQRLTKRPRFPILLAKAPGQ